MNYSHPIHPAGYLAVVALLSGLLLPPMSALAEDVVAEEAVAATVDAAGYPDDRPSWLDESPGFSETLDTWTVVTPPLATPQLAAAALQVQLRAAAETYLEALLADADADAPIAPPAGFALQVTDAWIEQHVSPQHRYDGEVLGGIDSRYEAAAQLHFLPEDRQWLRAQVVERELQGRLQRLAMLVLASGGSLFGLTAAISLWRRRVEARLPG